MRTCAFLQCVRTCKPHACKNLTVHMRTYIHMRTHIPLPQTGSVYTDVCTSFSQSKKAEGPVSTLFMYACMYVGVRMLCVPWSTHKFRRLAKICSQLATHYKYLDGMKQVSIMKFNELTSYDYACPFLYASINTMAQTQARTCVTYSGPTNALNAPNASKVCNTP
jgi:hypothetical protein